MRYSILFSITRVSNLQGKSRRANVFYVMRKCFPANVLRGNHPVIGWGAKLQAVNLRCILRNRPSSWPTAGNSLRRSLIAVRTVIYSIKG